MDAIYLRWPDVSVRETLRRVRLLRVSPRPDLYLRARFDVALGEDIEGVMLPEASVDAARVRAEAPSLRVGVSRHDQMGLSGRTEGADFALLSPFDSTPSKAHVAALGPDRFQALVASCPIPVLALGGIVAANAGRALSAGASGVATVGAILGARDPLAGARRLRSAVGD